jgi:hypothetical protein
MKVSIQNPLLGKVIQSEKCLISSHYEIQILHGYNIPFPERLVGPTFKSSSTMLNAISCHLITPSHFFFYPSFVPQILLVSIN